MGRTAGVVATGEAPSNGQGVEVADGENAAPEATSWDAEANIYVRLLRARAEAKRMEKKGEHKDRDGKKTIYNYVLGDDITNEANRLFVKHGICPVPTAVERHEEGLAKGIKTTVRCSLKCVNVDKPDEFETFEAWGTGIDYSDKGDGKAYSYAVKYATAKALGLNTSDDIEEHGIQYEARPSDTEIAKEKVGVKDAMKAWADNLKAAIQNAASLQEIKDIRRNNRTALMAEDLPEVTRDYFIDLIDAREAELS